VNAYIHVHADVYADVLPVASVVSRCAAVTPTTDIGNLRSLRGLLGGSACPVPPKLPKPTHSLYKGSQAFGRTERSKRLLKKLPRRICFLAAWRNGGSGSIVVDDPKGHAGLHINQ
jgi:hypothetical protein